MLLLISSVSVAGRGQTAATCRLRMANAASLRVGIRVRALRTREMVAWPRMQALSNSTSRHGTRRPTATHGIRISRLARLMAVVSFADSALAAASHAAEARKQLRLGRL